MNALRTLVPLTTALVVATAAMAQAPCATPPGCIVDNTITAQGGGDMNSGAPFNLNSWFVSHGTPTLFGNDSPSNASACSIWMWSYSGGGEGVFTCYDFQPGQAYTVCLWVRNTNAITGGGHLQVWMTNGLTVQSLNAPPLVVSNSQLIDSSWVNNANWTQLSFTVTPQSAFSQLLIYPFMAGPPINNLQYELQIDDIRVSPQVSAITTLAIAVQPPMITWCDTASLCVSGAAPGSTISWTPAAGLSNTTGPCVNATPCGTTLYTATVSAIAACPNACTPTVSNGFIAATVLVEPPTVRLLSEGPALCGGAQRLVVEKPDPFCGTGEWVGPDGSITPQDTLFIDPLSPGTAGPWTYRITDPGGTCTSDAATLTIATAGTTAEHFLPNAFTPNGDGINDRFFPQSTYGFARYSLLLFDRWGGLLRTVNDAEGWDGTVNGELLPNDVYAWRAEYVLACDTRTRRASGHVVCLR